MHDKKLLMPANSERDDAPELAQRAAGARIAPGHPVEVGATDDWCLLLGDVYDGRHGGYGAGNTLGCSSRSRVEPADKEYLDRCGDGAPHLVALGRRAVGARQSHKEREAVRCARRVAVMILLI